MMQDITQDEFAQRMKAIGAWGLRTKHYPYLDLDIFFHITQEPAPNGAWPFVVEYSPLFSKALTILHCGFAPGYMRDSLDLCDYYSEVEDLFKKLGVRFKTTLSSTPKRDVVTFLEGGLELGCLAAGYDVDANPE